jgi:hypothetical protein
LVAAESVADIGGAEGAADVHRIARLLDPEERVVNPATAGATESSSTNGSATSGTGAAPRRLPKTGGRASTRRVSLPGERRP